MTETVVSTCTNEKTEAQTKSDPDSVFDAWTSQTGPTNSGHWCQKMQDNCETSEWPSERQLNKIIIIIIKERDLCMWGSSGSPTCCRTWGWCRQCPGQQGYTAIISGTRIHYSCLTPDPPEGRSKWGGKKRRKHLKQHLAKGNFTHKHSVSVRLI